MSTQSRGHGTRFGARGKFRLYFPRHPIRTTAVRRRHAPAHSLPRLPRDAHRHPRRNEAALRILDQVIELYPDYVPARAGRGVLRARLQQRKAAHQDADDALARDLGAATQYQVAGIFALTSRQDPVDRAEALRYLSSALRKGFGFDLLEQDKDLDPIRDRPEFRQLVNAARALQVPAAKKP